MKKLISLIAVAIVAIIINCCGVMSTAVTEYYVGKGKGESAIENMAREKAYVNAVADITRHVGRQITENAEQTYSSLEKGGGRSVESLQYGSTIVQNSAAHLGEIVIVKEVLRYRRGRYICEMTVRVNSANIE